MPLKFDRELVGPCTRPRFHSSDNHRHAGRYFALEGGARAPYSANPVDFFMNARIHDPRIRARARARKRKSRRIRAKLHDARSKGKRDISPTRREVSGICMKVGPRRKITSTRLNREKIITAYGDITKFAAERKKRNALRFRSRRARARIART